jgi:DNA-binding NtrC family response regulator
VIRIHVPPLRDRREEIPHLSTFFLREASERLGKPDIQLSSEALDMFSQYWWPGNVRQLKNEIQRAVAMSAPGGTIEAAHLSPEIVERSLIGDEPRVLWRPAPANSCRSRIKSNSTSFGLRRSVRRAISARPAPSPHPARAASSSGVWD